MNYIYSENELESLQDFSNDNKNNVRLFCLVMLSLCYISDYMFVEKLKPWHFFVPFTNLTLVITTISICKSISASIYKSAGPSDHFFYTMAIIMNFVTVCTYWSIIHKTKR